MRVSESVFRSLQGEGPDTGVPTTFIRLAGCNLRCAWCDTKYALNDGEDRPIEKLLHDVSPCLQVCITGGEPLLQEWELKKLVHALVMQGCVITIETNGSLEKPIWPEEWGVRWDVDSKCPSAKLNNYIFSSSWKRGRDIRIKFVVATEEDLDFVRSRAPTLPGAILISPAAGLWSSQVEPGYSAEELWDRRWLQRVWQFCVDNDLRYSLQVHKVVFGNKKGV